LTLYRIQAWYWSPELEKQFGRKPTDESPILRELSDAEVVELIREHGRADIKEWDGDTILDFQNDYD
jgi:hypothetical protein